MVDKSIETKSKAAFQSPTGIYKMDICYQKDQKLNKKEEIFKFFKKEKVKLVDSQPTILSEIGSQSSGQNL